ncbi:MAG: hypothetical protein Fur0010_08160 [Bdellovibrio sp.]
MAKLLKILGILILIGFVSSILILGRRWMDNPSGPYPYPYTFKSVPTLPQDEIAQAQVLLVGDRLGTKLSKYVQPLLDDLSKDLRKPLKMVDLTSEGEPLYRTLHKLKHIGQLPPLVIYHGGADEFYEKKLDHKFRKLLLGNIQKYRNEKINSIVHAFPWMARLIFSPTPVIELKETPEKYEEFAEAIEKQIRVELYFKFYELELEEFISFIKNQKSRFIVITPPINIELPPKEPCGNSETPSLNVELNAIEKMIEESNFKEAYQRIGQLQPMSLANARTYYLFGMATKGIGRPSDARGLLYRATAFDCIQDRPTLIGYKLLLENMEKESVPLIDFNRIVNLAFGNNVLFLDEITPQGIFYNELMNELRKEIKKALNI